MTLRILTVLVIAVAAVVGYQLGEFVARLDEIGCVE